MKILIVDDNFTNRLLLQELLRELGPSHLAVNGREAVAAVQAALAAGEPYDLICLDIMMPELDGHGALKQIRGLEGRPEHADKRPASIVMVTALHDPANVMESFQEQCDGYLIKPIDHKKLFDLLRKLGLVDATAARVA